MGLVTSKWMAMVQQLFVTVEWRFKAEQGERGDLFKRFRFSVKD